MKQLLSRPQDTIIGVSELSRLLGYTRKWCYDMIKSGVLEVVVETQRGKIFDRQQVIKFKRK